MDVAPSEDQVRTAYELVSPCRLCPRRCGVNRAAGGVGRCGIGDMPVVASAGPHFGEEPPLVGTGGSGTIFLSGCNLLCAFCQNYDISHDAVGRAIGPPAIADLMLALQRHDCENINFVTPTHVTPWLMDAVRRARLRGLHIPIVYNCGGYESLDTLRLLQGTVDIYMPDAKFWSREPAQRYMQAPDYPDRMRDALIEMRRQVGVLRVEDGIARRGLLVRHLVMPGAVEDSKAVLRFIAEAVSRQTWVNVMAQYRPMGDADLFPEIARPTSTAEWAEACTFARSLGLNLL